MKKIFTLFAAISFAEIMMAAGLFSISEDKQVAFASGNLQFHMKDSLWRFAPSQVDWMGNANLEMGNPDYDGWVDLFAWSIGEENNYGATSNYDTLMCANKDFVDWGDMFTDYEWFTMSKEEWDYVLNKRTDANDKWGMALIGDTLGMILLPDEWNAPEGITFVPRTNPTSELWDDEDMIDNSYDHYRVKPENMPANLFTLSEWEELETAGAVFLPYAGRRSGGYGNYLNTKCQIVTEMFRYSYYENYLGTYWTSTLQNKEKGQAVYIYTFSFYGGDDYRWGKAVMWGENGRYGQSVRLARIVEKGDPTDIEITLTTSKAVKVMKDGQILIIKNGQAYNAIGQIVL